VDERVAQVTRHIIREDQLMPRKPATKSVVASPAVATIFEAVVRDLGFNPCVEGWTVEDLPQSA